MHRFVAVLALASAVGSRMVTLSNVALPNDDRGLPLLTGESTVLAVNGTYWVSATRCPLH